MPRFLVIYGTGEGHTEKVAYTMADALTAHGADVNVIQAGTIDPAISTYDGVIVAASVHHGRFQKDVTKAVRAHARDISMKPNVFVPVCLGALRNPDPAINANLQIALQLFYDESAWTPMTTKPVAGALAYSRYNLLRRWIMKHVVAPAMGADTNTSRDYVYTDWDQLRAFAADFSRQALAGTPDNVAPGAVSDLLAGA